LTGASPGLSMPESRSVPRWLLVLAVVTVLLGVWFRFYRLDGKVFWEDEILGTIHTLGYREAEIVEASPHLESAADLQRYFLVAPASEGRGLGATVASLAAEDPQHPPLYYLLARLWAQVNGTSAVALRSLPALFGVLVLPFVWWLAAELFASGASATLALALVAVSPFYVLYAQEAREYSLWTVAIVAAGALLLRALRGGGWWWLGYAVVLALSMYIYPLTGLVAIGFFLYVFFGARLRVTRAVASCFGASLFALIAFAPWLVAMRASPGLGQGMATIMRAKLTPAAFAFILARDLRFPYFDLGAFRIGPLGSTAVNAALTVFCVALSAWALGALVRRRPFAAWGFVLVGLCLPMTALLGEDLFVRGHFVYQARYFIPALLGIQLAVADLFAARLVPARPARPAWATLFGLILAGEVLSCVVSSRAETWWNKAYERSPSVARIVNAAPHPVVTGDYYSPSVLALGLYLRPDVALRLVARCTQCTVEPPQTPAPDLTGFGSVFVLRADPPENNGNYRWVDPQTFPARPDPLNLFTAT
jgi:uncharacterized membrane protein